MCSGVFMRAASTARYVHSLLLSLRGRLLTDWLCSQGGEATPRQTVEWNGYFETPVKCQRANQDGTKRVSPRALLLQDIERVLLMMEEAAVKPRIDCLFRRDNSMS